MLTWCSISEAASEEWRQAADAYLRRFGEIRRWMPVGVRKLRSRFSLHDAKVVGIAADEDGPRLTLLLQIGPTAGRPAAEELTPYWDQYVAFNWDGTEIVASAVEEAELVAKLDAMGIPQRCIGIAWMGL